MKTTKLQLQERAEQCARDAGILHLALNDSLNGNVTWFRKGPHRLGISRACGAEGGIVIHTFKCAGQNDYSCAYYWEQWYEGIKRSYDALNGELTALRECAFAAHEFVMREQNKAFNAAQAA